MTDIHMNKCLHIYELRWRAHGHLTETAFFNTVSTQWLELKWWMGWSNEIGISKCHRSIPEKLRNFEIERSVCMVNTPKCLCKCWLYTKLHNDNQLSACSTILRAFRTISFPVVLRKLTSFVDKRKHILYLIENNAHFITDKVFLLVQVINHQRRRRV